MKKIPRGTSESPQTANIYGVDFGFTKERRKGLVTGVPPELLAGDLTRELLFFRAHAMLPGYTGPGAFYHCRNVIDMLWQQQGRKRFVWWDGMETSLEEFCQTDEVLITGPGSFSKTFATALYALVFWMCDPMRTGILCCAPTLSGLKRKLWGEIRNLFISARNTLGTGNLVDSKTSIQTERGNDSRGLFGIAVAEGEENKALGRIIGFHPPRILVIVDELTDVGWAIVAACVNLFGAKEKAQFIGLGNASNYFDSHGKMCEPKDGWNSVSVETERFQTKRGGVVIHFDALKSPNVLQGKKIYDFLPTKEDIEKTIRDEGENSPQMWRMRRGWWAPEGTVKSILSGPIISQFLCMEKAQWQDEVTTVAALDPAFEGGDRCVLRFFRVGKSSSGIDTLELEMPITIKTDLTMVAKRPMHFQISDQIKEACSARGVGPEHFGMDTTGEGGGLADVISEEWGPGFLRVEFGGSPDDMAISPTDDRPADEVYEKKVTALWYAFRVAVMANQIRGLDAETATELCNRLYEVKNKIRLETKAEMKVRYRRSPDLADNAVIGLEVARKLGLLGNVKSRSRQTVNRAWDNLVREFAMDEEAVYADDGMANV